MYKKPLLLFPALHRKQLKLYLHVHVPQQIAASFLLWRSIPKVPNALHNTPLPVKCYYERLWMCSGTLPVSAVLKLGHPVLFGNHTEQQVRKVQRYLGINLY